MPVFLKYRQKIHSTKVPITQEHEKALFQAGVVVLVIVIVIAVIKRFIFNRWENIAIEFNLLTYGFLWDVAMKGLNGEKYWSNFPDNPIFGKNFVLLLIALFNTALLAWNYKLTSQAKYYSDLKQKGKAIFYDFWSVILGSVSLCIFLSLKVYWE